MDSTYGPGGGGGGGGGHFSKPRPAGANIDANKIFVGGLSWQTTEETLRYHFEQYGEVVSVEVMRDRVTGDPRGFAFVVFSDDATVDLVMKDVGRHEINHKQVDVKRAQARGQAPPSIHPSQLQQPGSEGDLPEPPPTIREKVPGGDGELSPEQLQNKVFVGGIPLHIDRDQLRDHFAQFGAVADAIVMMDPIQRRSRGFGFVTFENGTGGAQKAMAAQPHNISGKYVEIKLATPKGDQNDNPHKRHPGGGGGGGGGGGAPLGLRAGNVTQSTGEFAGLAASYGRNGWRAGYGAKAFGKAGWAVLGWEDSGTPPEQTGFSFQMIEKAKQAKNNGAVRTERRPRKNSAVEDPRERKRTRY